MFNTRDTSSIGQPLSISCLRASPTADKPEAEDYEVEVVRARNDKGQLVGDDPSTPDVNEAWTTKVKKKITRKKKD